MKIALSKASGSPKYAKYTEWLQAADAQVHTVDLSLLRAEERNNALEECCGIIFTGGADVVPERYGRPEEYERCHVDHERDEMEFALVHKARELNMPVLGICRGAQLLNVAYGGTLIVDISTDHGNDIEHRSHEGVDARHELEVEPGTILKKICGVFEGNINSAHHQAVENLAGLFTVAAVAPDGIIEAFEVAEAGGNPFLLAVQWHPERMEYENPLSLSIAKHFLFECQSYELLLKGKPYVSLVEAKNEN